MTEPSNSDIMYKLGEMSGTMKTFTDSQTKINDEIFKFRRDHEAKIGSLLQTRRTQNKLIAYAFSCWAVISEIAHKFFSSGSIGH